MGFFSWKTADSEISISNHYSDRGSKPVYLLQPNGLPSILEPKYEGYGVFGGMDAYVWLARQNLPAKRLKGVPEDANAVNSITIRSAGITLEFGYKIHKPTGLKFVVNTPSIVLVDDTVVNLSGMWDEPQERFDGRSLNAVMAEGEIESGSFDIRFPLKFSYLDDAVYENLPKSDDCRAQGFFYPEESSDEDEDEDEPQEDEDENDLDEAA